MRTIPLTAVDAEANVVLVFGTALFEQEFEYTVFPCSLHPKASLLITSLQQFCNQMSSTEHI